MNQEYKSISNIALDRIVRFEPSKVKYQKNNGIDFKEYFDDIIGVTRPEKGKLTKIELLFSNTEAPYILTKPLHGSQKKKRHDQKGLLITLDLLPNVELEKLILSFGDNVKVLSPENFKKRIASLLKAAVINYQ